MRLALSIFFSLLTVLPQQELPRLEVSQNHRFLMTENGKPFFWLGDTGWLLLSRLTTEEAQQYFENRHKKGFDLIQVMLVHSIKDADAYGHPALVDKTWPHRLRPIGITSIPSSTWLRPMGSILHWYRCGVGWSKPRNQVPRRRRPMRASSLTV